MASFFRALCVGLVTLAAGSSSFSEIEELTVTKPLRRIINILESLQKKVDEEGKKAEEIHKKFMKFCSSNHAGEDAADAESKVPILKGDIKEKTAQREQLESEIDQQKQDYAAAQEAVAKAKALHEKETIDFAKEVAEKKSTIAALGKAIVALEKGMKGEFLQNSVIAVVQRVSLDMDLSPESRDQLSAFLSVSATGKYAPASGQIVGVLKQMKKQLETDLDEMTDKENQDAASAKKLIMSKQKEVDAAAHSIQTKRGQLTNTAVDVVNLKQKLEDTQESHEADTKFAGNQASRCEKEEKDWEASKDARAQELLALSETIKILNEDSALDLFKKTLPNPSLLQMQVTNKQLRIKAWSLLRSRQYKDIRLDLIALALHGQKVNLDKVVKMIDDMVKLLTKEQHDDDLRKEMCEEDLDKQEDKLKASEQSATDAGKAITNEQNAIENANEEINAVGKAIKDLDVQVADITETRKQEHQAYEASLADNKAAKELLLFAKNRLNKFYNPKLHKEKVVELSDEERISQKLAFEEVQDAPNFLQRGRKTGVYVSLHFLSAQPQGTGEYKAKTPEINGVMDLLNMLILDLEKAFKAQEVEETDAQQDYEAFLVDSKTKRIADSKSLEKQMGLKSELDTELLKLREQQKSKLREAYATTGVLGSLHQNCDWLLQNFNTRKEARASEKDSLVKAKAILFGMDSSL